MVRVFFVLTGFPRKMCISTGGTREGRHSKQRKCHMQTGLGENEFPSLFGICDISEDGLLLNVAALGGHRTHSDFIHLVFEDP